MLFIYKSWNAVLIHMRTIPSKTLFPWHNICTIQGQGQRLLVHCSRYLLPLIHSASPWHHYHGTESGNHTAVTEWPPPPPLITDSFTHLLLQSNSVRFFYWWNITLFSSNAVKEWNKKNSVSPYRSDRILLRNMDACFKVICLQLKFTSAIII